MPVVHYTVTVTATATDLKTLAGLEDIADRPLQVLSVQGDPTNGAGVVIGGPGVTLTNYLARIPAPTAGNAADPILMPNANGRPVHIGEFYALGNAGDKLHVGGVIW